MPVRTSPNEEQRIDALEKIVAALGEPDLAELRRVAKMAARSLGAEFAAVTMVDGTLTRFVAGYGIDFRALSRDQFFCSTTILGDRMFVCLDARSDPRFARMTVVAGSPFVRFYAGVPLRSTDGARIGTLSVFDPDARSHFGEEEREIMLSLSEQATRTLRTAEAGVSRPHDPAMSTLGSAVPRTPAQGSTIPPPIRQPAWTPQDNYLGERQRATTGDFSGERQRAATGEHDATPFYFGVSLAEEKRHATDAMARELLEQPEFLQRIIDSNPNPVFIKNSEERFVMANAAGAALFGRSTDQLIGMREADLAQTEDGRDFSGSFERVTTDIQVTYEADGPRHEQFVDSAGRERWFEMRRRCLQPSPTGARYILTIATEITELKQAESREADRLALTRVVSGSERLEVVLEQVAGFVERHIEGCHCFIWTRRGQEIRVSLTPEAPLAVVAQVRTRPCPPDKIPHAVGEKRHRPVFEGPLIDNPQSAPYRGPAEEHGFGRLLSMPICNAAGAVIGVLDVLSTRSVVAGRSGRDVAAAAKDLAAIAIEQRRRQSMLSYQAQFDPLTHLPNRYELEARVHRALAHGRRHGHMVGLLYIDLDRFKHVNDTLGHAVGDALLREVAGRFEACLRTTDSLARMGGDEFAAVLSEVADTAGATRVAQKLMESLQRPFDIAGFSLVVTTTIGIAMFPNDGDDAATLLRNADAALHRAKETGRDTFRFFARDIHDDALERLELETALREAITNRWLELHLQPQLDVRNGRTVGFEALARWKHPRLGSIAPSKFIPLAEESRLIGDIGQWALEEACIALRRWLDVDGWPIRVGVNVSPYQLVSDGFVEMVDRTIREYAVPPRMIELEITENAMVSSVETVVPKLHALQELGVSIAIDDFGTGYSNLAYLQTLPIDRVKIDRGFVARIDEGPDGDGSGARLVRAIIDIAHTFDLEVIAEGVETPDQLVFLRNAGCEIAQGYLYHAPMAVPDAIDAVR